LEERDMNDVESEVRRQLEIITAGTAEVIPEDGLEKILARALKAQRPLRVKYGIDPTSPHVHIGHLVPCGKLRDFQDCGHTAVLVIGDYTARIGDPSGRDAERAPLSEDQVARNMKSYVDQLYRAVDPNRTEVRYQSEWFADMPLSDFVHLSARFSVAQLLAHETFRKRMEGDRRLSVHELLYPMMQAHDSVAIRADVEIGGTDQKFNCLCGRDLQKALGMASQVVLTVPLLMGSDGEKMSKSRDNHIPVSADAREMIGRIMAISDDLIPQYIMLASSWSREDRTALIHGFESGEEHPRGLKMRLARNIASRFHPPDRVAKAAREFQRVFAEGGAPDHIRIFRCDPDTPMDRVLKAGGLAASTSEARRLISQGGVTVDGIRVNAFATPVGSLGAGSVILRVGRRRFVKVVW